MFVLQEYGFSVSTLIPGCLKGFPRPLIQSKGWNVLIKDSDYFHVRKLLAEGINKVKKVVLSYLQ